MTTQTNNTTQAPKTGHQETPNTPEQLTILQTVGPLLAKQWKPDGTIAQYEGAKWFTVHQAPVANIRDLHALLQELSDDPQRCIIRGKPKASALAAPKVQRQLIDFDDRPSRLFMVDVDNFESLLYSDPWNHPEEVAQEIIRLLPMQFQGMSHIIQLSNSCGHPTVDVFKAHLWFWLDEPMTCEEAETYTAVKLKGIGDRVVHRTVQVNYTADPVMQDGVQDTVTQRLIFVEGWMGDELDIRPLDPDELPSEVRTGGRKGRDELVDPREKTGVIGALCRAFSPEQIVDLWPKDFSAGRDERRITWHGGGGSPEGVGVSTSGTHLFNTQNTSPIGDRAANLFDFIRAHIFGHRDEGVGEGAAELDHTSLPSYQATVDWALSLPEVQEETRSEAAQEATEARAETKALTLAETAEAAEQTLEKYRAQIDGASSMPHLLAVCARIGLDSNLGDLYRPGLADRVKARSKTLGSPLSIGDARKALNPVETVGTLGATLPNLSPTGQPQLTIDNLSALCAARGVTIRKDVIRKRVEILAPGEAFSTGGAENESLAWLQSECAKVNMNINTGQLKSYVSRLAALNQFNPVLAWIESTPWDGVDRLPELYATITHAQDFDQSLKEKMIRKWLIQAVAVAASPDPIQARGVLVVQGAQYLGKSRWLQSLCSGPRDLVKPGHQLEPHKKDSVKIAISHWLCELGELDATLSKSDVAALKAFFANDTDTMRLPYAAAETTTQRQTVFFGSVNDDEFLSDTTGNTRFWVIPVTAMDHNHTVDMQQLWAQVLHLWRGGEEHWLSREDMKLVDASASRFAKTDDIGLLLEEKYDPALPLSGQPWRTVPHLARLLGLGAKLGDGRGFTARFGRAVTTFIRGRGWSTDDHKKRAGSGFQYRLQLQDDAMPA